MSTLPIASMGIFLAIIVVGGVTAQEYGWRSLQLWLCQGVPRSALFAAKVAVCFFCVLLITLGALITGIITSLIAALQLHQSIDLGRLDLLQLFISWLRISYSMLPYVTLSFLLAVLARSPLAAVSVGLVFAVIVEMLMLPLSRLSPVLAHVWSVMPLMLANSLDQLNFAAARYAQPPANIYENIPLIDPLLAALGIALYTIIFLGLAYWVFSRQNLNG